MDRGQFLPSKKNVGAQLGLGIRNSALYVASTDRSQQADTKWIFGAAKNSATNDSFLLIVTGKEKFLDNNSGTGSSRDTKVNSDWEHTGDDLLLSSTSDSESESITVYGTGSKARDELPLEGTDPLKLFRDVRLLPDSGYETRVDSPVTPLTFCPGQILSVSDALGEYGGVERGGDRNLSESASFSEKGSFNRNFKLQPQIVDPTDVCDIITGMIHTTSGLRMNSDAHQIVAYASGETQSIINFSLVDTMDANRPSKCAGEVWSYDLQSKIKNIVVPEFSPILNRAADVIAVLTENSLQVFKVKFIERSSSTLSIENLGPCKFSNLEDFAFVDIAFNPWDFNEFAVIDTKGNWTLGNIVKKGPRHFRLRLSGNKRGSIYDPEELSSWHKIAWGAEYSSLLLVSRSRLIELNFRRRLQLDVIEAKSWSSLRDFTRVDDQIAVLTTSKEIILIDLKGNDIKRLVSWKHSLDPEDVSIKAFVRTVSGAQWSCQYERLFFVFVYSGLKPGILVHVFFQNGLLFQSIGVPSLLQIDGILSGLSCLASLQTPVEFHQEAANAPQTPGFECLFREIGGSMIWRVVVHSARSHLHPTKAQNKNSVDFGGLDSPPVRNVNKDFIDLPLSLPSAGKDYDASNEESLFQQYGYDLSDGMNKHLVEWAKDLENPQEVRGPKCYSFAGLAEPISKVENMEEFGSLLEQFKIHYQDQEISFTDLTTLSSLIIQENVAELGILYNKLLQCWSFGFPDDKDTTSEVLKSIILKNTGICSVAPLPFVAKNAYNELSDSHREIINSWDDVSDETETIIPLSEISRNTHTQEDSNFPSVRASQQNLSKSRNPKKKALPPPRALQAASQPVPGRSHPSMSQQQTYSQDASNILPNTMAPAFSLISASQPVPTLSDSQTQNSQRHRKKKKRVKGFG
ncbi:LAME_0F01090g1_1 [Lachancea meyersii CBS 8951]|uniref:LAME_0F01090g1_1 n=1 Tax=Lachancea meyersii CBS 8951 TaxID=1266667 RepID=A0A1G4JPU3_9SACH|nr:LAME_0F01090g1_1 [Lachancea meyersii CBS 8951]